jgi:RNA polymerase sigma-70 factor (ECF subfamily)
MLLHDARRAARAAANGDLILLADQDRALWDLDKITRGLELVERSLSRSSVPSPYALQAAIAALHARAPDADSTDWQQIVSLYEVLLRLQPSPVIELNHAVAVSMVDGAARALDLVDSLAARGEVVDSHLLHAARGRFLSELGRGPQACSAYEMALSFAKLEPERRFLKSRIAALRGELMGTDRN